MEVTFQNIRISRRDVEWYYDVFDHEQLCESNLCQFDKSGYSCTGTDIEHIPLDRHI